MRTRQLVMRTTLRRPSRQRNLILAATRSEKGLAKAAVPSYDLRRTNSNGKTRDHGEVPHEARRRCYDQPNYSCI